MLNKDRRLTIRHIAETTSINCSTVHWIVSEDLGMRKVSARWVPRMLTEEQKTVRVNVCSDLLSRLQAEPHTFLDRIVTQDETWVHHFHPETKRQSMIWKQWRQHHGARGACAPTFTNGWAREGGTVEERLITTMQWYANNSTAESGHKLNSIWRFGHLSKKKP